MMAHLLASMNAVGSIPARSIFDAEKSVITCLKGPKSGPINMFLRHKKGPYYVALVYFFIQNHFN